MSLLMPGMPQCDHGSVLGLRTSYDRSFANGICIGATVFVCDNLSFQGEVKFERKHTPGMLRYLSWMITESIATLPQKFQTQLETFNRYKASGLTDKEAHDLAVQLWDSKALCSLEIAILIQELRAPKHPEFATGKTFWRFFNAATEIIKGDLWRLPARTSLVHKVLDQALGIADSHIKRDEAAVLAA